MNEPAPPSRHPLSSFSELVGELVGVQLNSDNTMFELESDPLPWSGSEHPSLDASPSCTMSEKITL